MEDAHSRHCAGPVSILPDCCFAAFNELKRALTKLERSKEMPLILGVGSGRTRNNYTSYSQSFVDTGRTDPSSSKILLVITSTGRTDQVPPTLHRTLMNNGEVSSCDPYVPPIYAPCSVSNLNGLPIRRVLGLGVTER